MTVTEIYLGQVTKDEFGKNRRGELARNIHDGSSRKRADVKRDGHSEA
jgi:hypothetical protein